MNQTLGEAKVESSSKDAGGHSPLETFILEEMEPRRGELNTFNDTKGHTKLLLDAARLRKLRAQKIGWTHISTFALYRSATPIAGIYGNITTLVSHQALRATSSRELTRQCLVLSKIPQLPGKTLNVSQEKAAASFMERLDQPISIRPSARAIRKGISAHLSTGADLARAWERATSACAKLPVIKQQIDIEAFLPWIPLRVFVVGEHAVAAVARVPLYAVGDGSQTLSQLAVSELKRRKAPAFLETLKDVRAAGLLKARELDPDMVLPTGRLQLLSYDHSGQQGQGWSIDIREQLSESLGELAVNAMWAFPGLGATAVDILTPSLSTSEGAVVSGVEPGADLREFRFPAFGVSQFPNRAILDRIAALAR